MGSLQNVSSVSDSPRTSKVMREDLGAETKFFNDLLKVLANECNVGMIRITKSIFTLKIEVNIHNMNKYRIISRKETEYLIISPNSRSLLNRLQNTNAIGR